VGRAPLIVRVLIVLSQRPELTGSGITVDALVREARAAGHEPWVLCGVPAGEPVPSVGGLAAARVRTVTFGPGGDLPFDVPGMSDVMPYPSTVWSAMTTAQLDQYRRVWRDALNAAIAAIQPDVIHGNHLWLVSALLREAAGPRPVVVHCHATGLRQLALCPGLRDEVMTGLRSVDRVVVLHAGHADAVADLLGLPAARIVEVGAGYREDLFHARDAAPDPDRCGQLLYVGKFAAAKGLPWLLDAIAATPDATLHVAGDGAGPEAEGLRRRMGDLTPRVVMHGRLDQAALGDLMRRCAALVLPSFYEGLPLVLAEARACGCRLVSTALPGVVRVLAPALGPDLDLVDPPRLDGPDTPVAADLPAFTARLAAAIAGAAASGPRPPDPGALEPFTWRAVFRRVEAAWLADLP
jgi:glycosyltransferase involved in cell wall biosynthesis